MHTVYCLPVACCTPRHTQTDCCSSHFTRESVSVFIRRWRVGNKLSWLRGCASARCSPHQPDVIWTRWLGNVFQTMQCWILFQNYLTVSLAAHPCFPRNNTGPCSSNAAPCLASSPVFPLTGMQQCLAPHSSLQVQRQHPDILQSTYSLLPLP